MSAVLLQAIVASTSSSVGPFTPPSPGSFNPPASSGLTYSAQGTPVGPGTGYAGVNNSTAGYVRKTYLGQWTSNYTDMNPSIFDGSPVETITDDSYISFGLQSTGGDNYCMEWKGYFKASATANWNFVVVADDVVMFWIGDAALTPDNNNWTCNNGVNTGLNANSVSLVQDFWYPIRVRYQEWSGDESLGIYGAPADSELISLFQYGWMNTAHNSISGGY